MCENDWSMLMSWTLPNYRAIARLAGRVHDVEHVQQQGMCFSAFDVGIGLVRC